MKSQYTNHTLVLILTNASKPPLLHCCNARTTLNPSPYSMKGRNKPKLSTRAALLRNEESAVGQKRKKTGIRLRERSK
jgi:hypothetical protein